MSTRQPIKAALAAALLCLAASCAPSTPSGRGALNLSAIPANLQHCPKPGALPDRDLTQGEVARLWATDRAALVRCSGNLDGVVRYYDDLRKRFGGAAR